MTVRYLLGDTRDVCATIPDGSVDLVFTSPPFLALRSYLPADHEHKHKEIGSEANPAAFLDVLLELTADWRRILAPHGTLAVELGDTYSGGADGSSWDVGFDRPKKAALSASGSRTAKARNGWPLAKSLACIPDLYKIALAYGINPLTGTPSPAGRFRVRNDITWLRPNPPVGALGDKWRPASSRIIVACTGARRWFDLDAVRGPLAQPETKYERNERRSDSGEHWQAFGPYDATQSAGAPPLDWHTDGDIGVGSIILATAPYKGSHYATFPPELPRKIIDCMCPRQVCTVCGKPRERLTEASYEKPPQNPNKTSATAKSVRGVNGAGQNASAFEYGRAIKNVETLGWSDCGCIATCEPCSHDGMGVWCKTHGTYLPCNGKWRPGHVLDPFAGTGTTLMAAQDLGRDATGIDIDERNAYLARERVGMFLEVVYYISPVVDVVSDLL